MAEMDLQHVETKQSEGGEHHWSYALCRFLQVCKTGYSSAHSHCNLCSHPMPPQTEFICPAAN